MNALMKVVMLLVFSACLSAVATLAGEIQPATDRPQPKSPAESARCVQLPHGFRLDLVAAEPQIREPAAIAFDERGGMFVGEIHGYNVDGYLDILELNKSGKLDREVRRVRHATPESQAAAKKQTYGTVRRLQDTDGDGRMDKVDVWADRLPPCYGVVATRGGVIAICAPDIVYLADRDGDGQAEIRDTLFTGFARDLIERGMSNPRRGPDNWIYVAAGGGGGQITGPKLAEPVTIGHTDFRFKPDGTALEPVTGREGMFGLTMTDFGDRFHTIVSYCVPLPHRYLARNPYVQSPEGDVSINPSRTLFPISQPDPWRKARGQAPAWVKFYGAAETQPNGQFTASSGQLIYRAEALPPAYRGNYFVCDPANNLVHRCLLERRGSEYSARRAPENENSEFLASSDQWFRPMNLDLGPDGAIYIVDMYREIIEDFSAIPRFLQQQYAESLVAGQNHGRIWRLSWLPDAAQHRPAADALLDAASIVALVQALEHPNAWRRETAQRLLVERGDVSAVTPLVNLVRRGKTPQGRLLALYALDGLARLEPADVVRALEDESDGVRMHGLQLADRWLDKEPAVLDSVLAMTNDPEPRVRLQLAMTLGESRDERAIAALSSLAAGHGEERWMSSAIVSSLANSADLFLRNLLSADKLSPGALTLLGPAAEIIGARRDEAALARFLQQIANLEGQDAEDRKLALLDGLVRGLQRGKPASLMGEAVAPSLERLLADPTPQVSQQAVRVAGLLRLSDSPAMQRAWQTAGKTARDVEQPLATRLGAVSLLSVAPWSKQQQLHELLDSRQPTELQLAVVRALGNSDQKEVVPLLLTNWTGLIPKVQESVVDALFARQDRLPLLLDAVQQGAVPAVSLSSLRREQLLEHGNQAIRERARSLLAGRSSDDRAAVVERYATALTLPRDPARGEGVFLKTCSKCHRLQDKGAEVGPELLAARTRPDGTLLVDILDPSSAITHGFTAYSVLTADGRVHTGLLAGDAATSVTLRNPGEPTASEGAAPSETTILRKDIEQIKAMTKSLMPESLEKELTPQDVADLLGFLRRSLGPAMAPGLVLFDDEPEFVSALNEGGARASLSTDDKHAGQSALHLTAGQRFSPRIAGWEHRIVEHPVAAPPTERSYRYLRFAWKSDGAKGVLIELAASGTWPPAEKPLRRYYSGENGSGWQATEVSADVPTEWTVVTVDLWKDFGEFRLTGIAPTAMGGPALFDRIELLESLPERAVSAVSK